MVSALDEKRLQDISAKVEHGFEEDFPMSCSTPVEENKDMEEAYRRVGLLNGHLYSLLSEITVQNVR